MLLAPRAPIESYFFREQSSYLVGQGGSKSFLVESEGDRKRHAGEEEEEPRVFKDLSTQEAEKGRIVFQLLCGSLRFIP